MERYCSTGQSPQRAVAPTEEEEDEEKERNVKEKNVLLFKFRYNIFIGVRIIKEMPGSVASGTLCTCSGSHDIREIS